MKLTKGTLKYCQKGNEVKVHISLIQSTWIITTGTNCLIILMLWHFSGRKLRELRHDNLPDDYEDISVRDDELAVAGFNDNKLLLFRLKVWEFD